MAQAKGKSNRVPVALSCTECGSRNYKTTKSRSTSTQISLKKFCRMCDRHTVHIDSK